MHERCWDIQAKDASSVTQWSFVKELDAWDKITRRAALDLDEFIIHIETKELRIVDWRSEIDFWHGSKG